jgi:hypothetical protein
MAKNSARKQQAVAVKAPPALRQTMVKPIAQYTVAADLRTLMVNAKRLGRDDIWSEALRRLCVLEGDGQSDPLHRGFYEVLAAYEQLLSEKNARATRATSIRLKVRNKGVVHCLEEWATSKTPIEGYDILVAKGLSELTGEHLVLKYPEQFSPKAVAAAKARVEVEPAEG